MQTRTSNALNIFNSSDERHIKATLNKNTMIISRQNLVTLTIQIAFLYPHWDWQRFWQSPINDKLNIAKMGYGNSLHFWIF